MDYKYIYLAINIIHSSLNLDPDILTRYAKQADFFCYRPKKIKHLKCELGGIELLVTQSCDLLKAEAQLSITQFIYDFTLFYFLFLWLSVRRAILLITECQANVCHAAYN